jgi:hypothetical protein
MSFNKKEFREKEKELMLRAAKIEACNIDTNPGSYEEYRDGYRFMVKVSLYSFFIAFLFNLLSLTMVFFIDESVSYATTRDGRIQKVIPIAGSTLEMRDIKAKYIDKPGVLLKMRDFYNKTEEIVK